jgi:hypothetical protein
MNAVQPKPKVVTFDASESSLKGPGSITRYVRARSFLVAVTEAYEACEVTENCVEDVMVLLPDVSAEIKWPGGTISVPRESVVVLPAGEYKIRIVGKGRIVRLYASVPQDLQDIPLSADAEGPILKDIASSFVRSDSGSTPIFYSLEQFSNSPGMPRARLFQSATMSINWVEYEGPRNRSQLSPHSHDDIEQGSLALAGDFIHHLRTPWSKDANEWRDDLHFQCTAGSIALIPPGIIHTTEGVGDMRHILIDIFAPPRRDFIKKGQVLNSPDYSDTLKIV